MPLGLEHYTTFTEIANNLNHTSYHPEWSKTEECDRFINLIYDEALLHVQGVTRTNRLLALTNYLATKRLMGTDWFHLAPADVRLPAIFMTLGTALSRIGEQQIGRCGRFHRSLQAVWNETARLAGSASNADKRAAYEIWLNNVVLQLGEDFNFLLPPEVLDVTAYQINAGPLILNDGSDIVVEIGDRIDLFTSGINFLSIQWELDTVAIPGAVEGHYRNSDVQAGDLGSYVCVYSNASGDTSSDSFTVVTA